MAGQDETQHDPWEHDPWEEGAGGTATAVAEKPPEQESKPGALRRLSQVTLGTQHPLKQLGSEVMGAVTNPGRFAGDVSETVGIPREVWSDPSWENIRRIGGTGIPGMVFGEHGLIKHPIDTMENLTGANELSEDVRNKNYGGIPGDIAGGVLNLGMMSGKVNPLNAPAKTAEIAGAVKKRLGISPPPPPPTDFHGGAFDPNEADRVRRAQDFPDVKEGAVTKITEGPTAGEHTEARQQIKELKKPVPISEGPTAAEHARARKQLEEFNKPVVPISEGPTAPEHAAVRAGQAQVNKLAERKVVPLSESPTPEPEAPKTATGYEEENGIPIIGHKIGANAPEAATSGSEGTAARWTNESLPQLAKKGNRTAIEQLGRRNLPLPENVRYVMGDVDFPRIVLNPKEVSRFAPENTPIRDMSRPETSSRERIQPAGETIPPVEPLFQTPSMQVPSGPADTVHTGIHMDPVNPRVEGVLPGMEGDVARQAEGAAKVKGEDLTRQANTPKDINQAAGEMESKSPLFRGTEASPQKEIFAPGGESPAAHAGEPPTAEELSPEHVDLPKLKEAFTSAEADRQYVADEFHRGRATYKQLQDAQKASEKAKDAVDEAEGTNEQLRQLHDRLAKESERDSPERIDAARGLVLDTIDQLRSLERGGPSWSEYNADTRPTAAGREKGDFYGGKAGKIPSGIATIPWLKNHPKWGWSKLQVAMRSGKSKLYNEVMRAADDHLQGQTAEGRAANDARAQHIAASTPPPPPAKFASFQKPTRLTPPEEEPPF